MMFGTRSSLLESEVLCAYFSLFLGICEKTCGIIGILGIFDIVESAKNVKNVILRN